MLPAFRPLFLAQKGMRKYSLLLSPLLFLLSSLHLSYLLLHLSSLFSLLSSLHLSSLLFIFAIILSIETTLVTTHARVQLQAHTHTSSLCTEFIRLG